MKTLKIEDPKKYPPYMRVDILTRNNNIERGAKLCEHCVGTGNEFYHIYRMCPRCNGTGRADED